MKYLTIILFLLSLASCKVSLPSASKTNIDNNNKGDEMSATFDRSSLKTIDDVGVALKKFPDERDLIIKSTEQLIKSYEDVKKLVIYFPENKSEILESILKPIRSIEELAELLFHFPELKNKSFDKAFNIAESIDDFVKLSNVYNDKYSVCKDEALKLLIEFEDYITFAIGFPKDKNVVKKKSTFIGQNNRRLY